ncbi:ADP-ribosylation factor guanine nucleotide-exchange factor 1(brefeldin A-inhibited) [Trypanosoma theileri]|uniref:ADP-ribosylation factor guanine nucleotide-exchange factor 1(Brefeldin A-inhibited) n=1 Tax=Trypanosoma theileri TaxID=67003 RepID=A0A1X0P9Z2_9TRYP|nr:ADP-ribosylation factor guanine nucleotide-exchange factor 1(brefeldin A-inhibited) [Trypanosoma theileri]ORC93651.1 ADP-ribosylation factor guanine nucleotide-exchange factor 1(brefeldin A-inhibited) [Trypanosoma theileri]
MSWRYEDVADACGKVLNEEKSPKSRSLLNQVMKDLEGVIMAVKGGDEKKDEGSSKSSQSKEKSSTMELGEVELIRLGFACRLALLGNCENRFSSKSSIASLEFATILLNSGLIPTRVIVTPPEVNVPEISPGGAGDFFSKILGSGTGGGKGSTRSDTKETIPNTEKVNLFITIVEGVLALSKRIQSKEVNENVLFSLVTALQASAVPMCGRALFYEKTRNNCSDQFLAVCGDLLLRIVKELFSILKRNNVIPPLMEEVKSALNNIAKALSKSVEHETIGLNGGQLVESNQADGGFQVDAAKLLEYFSRLTKSSVLTQSSVNQQGNSVGIINSSNESSVVLLTALGLNLHLIVNGGPVFRNSKVILTSLKSSVIPSTLSAALLKDLDAFRLSVNVLLTCSITFGQLMVNETETIFRHLFFRVLESKTSSLTQKSLVVEAFRRYIEEPQNLLSLFLNYDCNTRSQSVYEQMIGYLVALSIPSSLRSSDVQDRNDSSFEKIILDFSVPETLQRSALTTLLLVPYSNRQWIERFECDQKSSFPQAESFIGSSVLSESVNNPDKSDENQRDMTAPMSTENENEHFIQAIRTKEAFRKFLYLLNETRDSISAIEFLTNEPLLIPDIGDKKSNTVDPIQKKDVNESSESFPHLGGNLNHEKNYSETIEEKLEEKASAIAVFLKDKEDYIDKLVLGDLFAKSLRKPKLRMIFVKWIEQHSFAGMTLDVALRLFLGGFKLLGEAEVVDKTMELFAAQYCKENPTNFRSANTAFILSFSICMLNTDAHSPHVKNKMTLDGFIRNNRGIDEGNDVDSNLLKGIYERIVSSEIKLRPSKYVHSTLNVSCNKDSSGNRNRSTKRISTGALESIPILKHFAPVARAITDTVMIPLDVAGNVLFNTVQRKREEVYQAELCAALKDVIEALDTTDALNPSFVEATKIENAIPMWSVTVDYIVKTLVYAFENFITLAETVISPQNVQGNHDVTLVFLANSQNRDYFDNLLRGLVNTVRVCCDLGNISHAEDLIERLFILTQIENVVKVSQQTKSTVTLSNGITKPRIELLATLLNLFLVNGSSLTTRSWCIAYTGVSLLDLIANGIEGIWKRQGSKLLLTEEEQPPPDTWFGNLEVPPSFDKSSLKRRAMILGTLRSVCSVDVWLDRLFDATEYPSQTQVFMSNALASVCEKELKCSRSFSLTKLFDFVKVCASFSSRMQWRDLWTNASKVFTLAGSMPFDIASLALGGLRIIALTYLIREELLNYSFQKEVLIPFEAILMVNQDVKIRQKVIETIAELIDFRASHLASGWNVVFSILSHSAVIPEVVNSAWDVCENIITSHVVLMKDCFSDLVFCLKSFACNNVDERIALLSTSYLKACGHWLQFGLEPPPTDVRDANAVSQWASRFKDADSEARASQFMIGIPRVTLSLAPITSNQNLEKSTSLTVKTNYDLWMSLLEEMFPITLIHPSVRVRAHVICSLWSLIGQYAIAFSTDIQDSLFGEILRPVISNLLMHAPVEEEKNLDSMDYKLLTFLNIKSMFLACLKHPHLLNLACETFTSICTTSLSLENVRAGLVDVILRLCVDLKPQSSYILQDYIGTAREPWVGRLCHELTQIGYVDVIHFKRTSSWTELHQTVAVTSSTVDLGASMGEEAKTIITNTVITCLADGVILQLFSTTNRCGSQQDHFLCSKTIRRAYLVLAFYCLEDITEGVFSTILSGFSLSVSNIPEQLLLIPYLCLLIEFVFVLRSNPPTFSETQTLQNTLNVMYQTIRKSRDFCVHHQAELVSASENDKTEGDQLYGSRKHRGRTFIDIFRSGKAPLTAQAKHFSRTVPERFFNEWVYLIYILGLKFAFSYKGIIADSITASTLHNIILLLPSELEEELVKPFFLSSWEELDVGMNFVEGSVISWALDVLERKKNLAVN